MDTPFLSLIIPAYNEENRLPATLDQVLEFLHRQSYPAEILVVDNASTDRTPHIIADYAQEWDIIHSLHESQPGKGAAVRKGMLSGRGEYRFMCDADLSMPIQELNRFIPPQIDDVDVAIATREAPESVRYNEPYYRHLGGRLMNFFIRLLVLPGLHDTQCGFKCFRAPIAEDLFSHTTLPGWSFDIEVLTIARLRGYKIKEVPIPWYFDEESKVHAVRDAIRMLLDVLTIRRNKQQGIYDPHN